MTHDRIPPHNLEAEMALIGSVLVDREIMAPVTEYVEAGDFYAHVHETIFQELTRLFEAGAPLDKWSVVEALRARGSLEKIGGVSYLSSLMDTVQTAASATYYAKIVREKSLLRSLIHTGTQITQLGYESEEDVDAAIDAAETIVLAVNQRNIKANSTTLFEVLKSTFNALDGKGPKPLTTGFASIDARLAGGGLCPGNFAIVAGRPGMGKTSFGLECAVAAARQAKREDRGVVWFISLEMLKEELGNRLISSTGRLNGDLLTRKNLQPHHWEVVSRALAELAELPIIVEDAGTFSVSQVRAQARRLKQTRGLAAIFVDYLQLLLPSVRSRGERTPGNRNEEVGDVCRVLKATAKDLHVPIVALAQINRGVENRDDKRPHLADLRESGNIEQEADLVAFLYREPYYDKDALDQTSAEFIVAKQRNGPTGTIPLRFEKEYTLYSDANDINVAV